MQSMIRMYRDYCLKVMMPYCFCAGFFTPYSTSTCILASLYWVSAFAQAAQVVEGHATALSCRHSSVARATVASTANAYRASPTAG